MWQLFFLLIGLKFASANGINRNMETTAGEDVDLRCPGTSANDPISSITWMRSNGSIVFNCDKSINPCTNINARHTLEGNITFISTVTIRNVSLIHEDDYHFVMLSPSDREICQINLTVYVPPKGLILVKKADNTILQDQGSLTVAEGENQTLVCKTNTSVKPVVNLEWLIPKELNASVDSQEYVIDKREERLLVFTRTIHFTPTYANDTDIVLICKVTSNPSLDHIQTSVFITNEGKLTTNTSTLQTGSQESYTTTASGDLQEPNEKPWYKQVHLVIPGCSGVVVLLIVLTLVGGSVRSKKRGVRPSMNAESTKFRSLQGRRALPPTPTDQSSLSANHLPDQPPPTSRLFRPVPSNPPDTLIRPLVPVSADEIRSSVERSGSRKPGETCMTTDCSTPVTHAQQKLDTEMEYELLNNSHHGDRGVVSHVYRETTNGLAEYALISRPKVKKRIDQRQHHRSKQIDDDSEYDLLNTWNQAEHGTTPHVYKETTSGLAEYAVVSKPDDKKKRQSLGHLTKVMKGPINVEAQYAVVDKSKKRAK